jgi:hypothetical protein
MKMMAILYSFIPFADGLMGALRYLNDIFRDKEPLVKSQLIKFSNKDKLTLNPFS